MLGRRIAPVVIAAVAVARSGGALAQPGDPGSGGAAVPAATDPVAHDPRLALRWLGAAQLHMQRGTSAAASHRSDEARRSFERAAAAYRKAIEAGDDINLYAELAGAEARLGKLDDAIRHLRRVVRAAAGVRPEVRTKAAARLDKLAAGVGIVTLTVTPPGTAITLGGSEIGTSPLGEPLVLRPGTYALAFHADGFRALEDDIKVEPGSDTEHVVVLGPVEPPPSPAVVTVVAPPPAVPAPAPAKPSRRALYVGVGITGAAAAAAGVFGGLAIARHATFTGPSSSPAERDAARVSGRRFAWMADASLATAATAAAVTTYWYFARYRRAENKPEVGHPVSETKLDVVPWVQSQSTGVTIAGRF